MKIFAIISFYLIIIDFIVIFPYFAILYILWYLLFD